ncbi:MAG: patatin-like phospholipase family protein [Alphaproteobacteria bacterium]
MVALALGGGAALGWAHIGALRVLEEASIEIDAIAGASIGALVGACALCRVLDPLEDIARGMNWRRLLSLADPLMGAPGLLKGAAVIAMMERYIGSRKIEELDRRFVAVAADLISGEAVRISSGSITEAVRASISIPGIFLPVERDGALLVDGGLVDPIPVSAARALGADIVVAIDVTGDYQGRARAAGIGPESEKGKLPAASGVKGIGAKLFRRSERRPGLYSVATTSAALIMRELALAKLAIDPPDLHVVPKVGHVSPADFDRADELIAAGRESMASALRPLREVLMRWPKKSSA